MSLHKAIIKMDANTGIGRGLVLDGQEIDVVTVDLSTGVDGAAVLGMTVFVNDVTIEKVEYAPEHVDEEAVTTLVRSTHEALSSKGATEGV